MPKVSVIIPIYKVEKYLKRCVDSALNQTLKDIEIILVDDGSPDKCPAICDQYVQSDERIRVIHKKNGGLASARNAGMKIASGEYIFFLDSDDWIDRETLECLTDITRQYDVDFVRFRPMCAGWPDKEDGSLCDFGTEDGLHEGVYSREEIIHEIYPRLFATPQLSLGVIVAAWRSLYKRSFIENNSLYFYEEVKYSEDTIFSARVVRFTESFYYLDGARFYHYFFNPSSITKSFRADRWESHQKLIRYFDENFADAEDFDFTNQLWLQKIYCVLSALGQRKEIADISERENYCRLICNNLVTREAFKHLRLTRTSWKLRIFLELIHYRKYRTLARI